MDGSRFRFFLHDLADKLRTSDIDKMKYLCSDKIEAGALDGISARDFFTLLQNRNLISPSDVTFLIQLLEDCDRKDLVNQVKRQSNSDVVPESGVASHALTSSHNNPHRVFLKQLSDELTANDLDSFKFLIGIPDGISRNLTSGFKVFDYLEKIGKVGISDMSYLAELFEAIHRKDIANKIKKYQDKNNQSSGHSPAVTQPVQTPTRQPTTHSQPMTTPPPRVPLLTPEHFQETPVFVMPIAPVEPPSPRAPLASLDEEDLALSYSMEKRPRGICLIFNNKTFTETAVNLQERLGTEKDVENLRLLWEKLHFNVVEKTNLTANDMYSTARDYSNIDHSDYDCFVCCILSHGINGGIYGSDGEVIEISQITSQFRGVACRSLADKPKMFFVQACRGDDVDHGVRADAVRNSDEDAMRHSAEPNEGHFLFGYATPPGYVSWRSTQHGSWYISHLCDVFNTHCERYDVLSMMVMVNDKVSDAFTKKGYKQCPAPVVTLRKKIYLTNN